MRIFDPEGPLMTALSKLADLVICNLMFIAFSLPVITMGASLTALYTCTLRIVDDREDDGLVFKTFWFAFRDNFRKATLLWLVCLCGIAFLTAYYWVTMSLALPLRRVYRITFYVLTIVFLVGFLYVFPLQAGFENSIRNTLRNAWLVSVGVLPLTLLNLVLVAAAVYVSFIMNPGAVNTFAYVWAVCGFALVAYLQSFLFRRAFRKMNPGQLSGGQNGHTEPSEGAVFTDEEHRTEEILAQESSYSNPDWNRREDIAGASAKTDGERGGRKRRRR